MREAEGGKKTHNTKEKMKTHKLDEKDRVRKFSAQSRKSLSKKKEKGDDTLPAGE